MQLHSAHGLIHYTCACDVNKWKKLIVTYYREVFLNEIHIIIQQFAGYFVEMYTVDFYGALPKNQLIANLRRYFKR